MANKRFKVALSFPGEHRAFVEEVAEQLAIHFGKDNIFYDNYYEEELARIDLDIYLMNIYKDHSELVAIFFCNEYTEKKWCGVEWRAIRQVIMDKRGGEIMPLKLNDFKIDGLLGLDGYIDVKERPAEKIAELIIKRYKKNEQVGNTSITPIPQSNISVSGLQHIEKQLEDLTTLVKNQSSPVLESQIQALIQERDALKEQLLKSEAVIQQQEQTKQDLEKSLGAKQEKGELKKQALEAVEAKDYDKAEELIKEAAKERIEKVAEDYYQLAQIKELKLEFIEAYKYYELAVQIAPDNIDYLHKAGNLARVFGNLDKAIKFLEKSLNIALQNQGTETEDVIFAYNELALVLEVSGDFKKAVHYYEKALAISLRIFNENHEYVATIYNNIGSVWYRKAQLDMVTAHLDRAIEYYERGLEIDLKLYGEKHPNIAIRYNNIGLAYQYKKELSKAINYFEMALKIDLEVYGKVHPKIATRYSNLGGIWRAKEDPDKAIEYYEMALEIDLKMYGQHHPDIAIDYNNIGSAWKAKDELEKAIFFGKKSYAILLELYGADNSITQIVKKNPDRYLEEKNGK